MKHNVPIKEMRKVEQECRRMRSEAIFNTFAGLPRWIWATLSAMGSGVVIRKSSSKPSLTVSAG
jgi:hypothetical protein